MSIRKNHVAALAAIAALFAAGAAKAQVAGAPNLEQTVLTTQQTVRAATADQKTLATTGAAQLQADQANFDEERGGPGGGRGPGRGPGRDPGRNPGRDPGRDPGRNPGRNPGRDPGRDPGQGGHGDHHPEWGHGDWGRWHGHPGWGRDRWAWRDGHWYWWGWAPWVIGAGVSCDVYYRGSYQQCSAAAWANNSACVQACGPFADPACNEACNLETRDAIQTCEFSYRNEWNCGFPVVWPPVGIVIRIP
jgi:hypothetical protein